MSVSFITLLQVNQVDLTYLGFHNVAPDKQPTAIVLHVLVHVTLSVRVHVKNPFSGELIINI